MKSNTKTELVLIIDRSGSMSGLESDTIGGINSVISKNREAGGECTVSTVLFDHETLVLHDRLPIENVRPLTRNASISRASSPARINRPTVSSSVRVRMVISLADQNINAVRMKSRPSTARDA